MAGRNPIFAGRFGGSDSWKHEHRGAKRGVGWGSDLKLVRVFSWFHHTWSGRWMAWKSAALVNGLGDSFYVCRFLVGKKDCGWPKPALCLEHPPTHKPPCLSHDWCCRNRSRKRWRTYKNCGLKMTLWRPNHRLWDLPPIYPRHAPPLCGSFVCILAGRDSE